MKTFTREYKLPALDAPIFNQYFGNKKLCVFDIETTGLSRSNCKVILTAMLTPTEGGVHVTQYLAENSYEENRVIEATLDYMESENIDYLVTYNGITFDVPFFNARCDAIHSDRKLSFYDLDLYSFFHKKTTLPSSVSSMSQKSVERFYRIGDARKDTISGKESVRLYREYMMNGDTILEKAILTHNREDVVQLYKLLHRTSFDDFTEILKCQDLDEALGSFGFPVCAGTSDVTNNRYVLRTRLDDKHNTLRINGDQLCDAVSIEIFETNNSANSYTAEFNKILQNLAIELKVESYGDDLFVNTKALGVDNELQGHPAYVNGYLILKSDGSSDYSAVNALATALLKHIIASYG